jgi:hypothetical protein
MTAGRLAATKAAATTQSTLYQCPIDKAASTALEVCNQSGTAATYRVGLRNYTQELTLDSTYSFQRGNVISRYLLTIQPGITTSDFDPGDIITLDQNQGSFKIQDIYQDTEIITYLTKVVCIGSASFDLQELTGTFSVGNTITGSTTGITATVYRITEGVFHLNLPNVTSSGTSFTINNNTGVVANDYIYTDDEIMRISSITDYNVTVTRGQLGTTAIEHFAGTAMTIFRASAITTTVNEGATYSSTDTTLTVASTTGLTIGSFIQIDNEFLRINSIVGLNLTVTRGEFGTTAATHADGSVITQQTTVTTGHFAFFQLDETVTNGLGASVDLAIPGLAGDAYNPYDVFVYNNGAGGTVYSYPSSIPADAERIIQFDQSDASNTSNPLRISLNADGTQSPEGEDLTTGVTINGTPGSAGAYTRVDLSLENVGVTSTYYTYNSGVGKTYFGTTIAIDLTPNYTQIYIFDPTKKIITDTDTFSFGNVNYTITDVTIGSYGYVTEVTGSNPSVIKIATGKNSSLFAENDTILDSPLQPASAREEATIDSIAVISENDYIVYDKSISAYTVERTTGIVVGPGDSLIVYSSAQSLSYVLHGFEDSTNDFTPIYYIRQSVDFALG